ncbi:MAG: hypothetical protein ACP5U0_10360 [Caldisphaera sp.]
MIETIMGILEFIWKLLNEGILSKFKNLLNWVRNSPIRLNSLILYMAIGSTDKDKFDMFCERLRSVYHFKTDEVTNDGILTHMRTFIISKNGLQLKVYLVNTPAIHEDIEDNNTLKVELMSQEISFRDGVNILKLLLEDLVTCAQNIFNSKAKLTYKMPLKNTQKINLKETAYKIHIDGDRAIIESNNLSNLQKVISLSLL